MPAVQIAAVDAARPPTSAKPFDDHARSRRRSALLRLARRHGEVRVAIRERGALIAHAPDVLELLDELNEHGRLSYGGLRKTPDDDTFIYRPA